MRMCRGGGRGPRFECAAGAYFTISPAARAGEGMVGDGGCGLADMAWVMATGLPRTVRSTTTYDNCFPGQVKNSRHYCTFEW